jgi:hypothetical protein
MRELEFNNALLNGNLFELFKLQLKKDFESCSVAADFVTQLPTDFNVIRSQIMHTLRSMSQKSGTTLNTLLYRIDISESQIRNYLNLNPKLSFEETVAELIIKRILQKVVLKKKFSE